MSGRADRLYELLPAVYRQRDAEQGNPLQAWLQVIAEQVNVVEDDIARLYENWFIETCDDWVVPYIADLIGYRPVHDAGEPGGVATAEERLRNEILIPRREVANTLRYRRRKGTLALLELLAGDVAGWPARAVEFYRRLAFTQNVNHRRRHRGRTVDVRRGEALDRLDGPFDEIAHNEDVRQVASALDPGRRNLHGVGLFVWRLRSYPVTQSPAFLVEEVAANDFTFSDLGNDTQLYALPRPEAEPTDIAGELNLPVPIRRRAFELHKEAFYGEGKSLAIWTGEPAAAGSEDVTLRLVPAASIVVANLAEWKYEPLKDQVAVDPELGRIAFPPRQVPGRGVWVSYRYGFSADVGGGEYDRPLAQPAGATVYRVGWTEELKRIDHALDRWRKDQPLHAVIEITDSGVYVDPIHVALQEKQTLEIRAARFKRPVIHLLDRRTSLPDSLFVTGKAGSAFTLDGLLVTGRSVHCEGDLAAVTLRHSTLVPGWGLLADCTPWRPSEPSLELVDLSGRVTIEHCILGAIQVVASEVTAEPFPLRLNDSILDATSLDRQALYGPNHPVAHVRLTLLRSHRLRPGRGPRAGAGGGLPADRAAHRGPAPDRLPALLVLRAGHGLRAALAHAAPLRVPAGPRPRGEPRRPCRGRAGAPPLPLRALRHGQLRPPERRLCRGDPARRRRRVGDGRLPRPVRTPASRQSGRPPRRAHPGRFRRGPDLRRLGGIMKGDFSRLTFDPKKQFTRVLMQQGRVQLDADWNEQAAILRHYLERLAADLIGPFGGPVKADGKPADGFLIGTKDKGLTVGIGHYYVDGLLVENVDDTTTHEVDPALKLPFLAYLDVWERHVTCIEEGSLREVALEGPDTTTRAQVAWQLRMTDSGPDGKGIPGDINVQTNFPAWVDIFQPPNRGGLKAQAIRSGDSTDPCVASPDAHFRGAENQLYRVEIHTGGKAGEGATFKWSRDNGSVILPVGDISPESKTGTTTVTLENLGDEERPALTTGDRVEIVDGDLSLGLLPVATVDGDRRQVTLTGFVQLGPDKPKHPLLRRWDYGKSKDALGADGALLIKEGSDVSLEAGIQISFQPADAGQAAHVYRAGDYWLFAARTVTGDIEWPQNPSPPPAGQSPGPATLPPFGVFHRYAPLALVLDTGKVMDRRSSFAPCALPNP